MSNLKRLLVAAYVVGALVSWPLCSGMFYHDVQAISLRHYDGVHELKWAAESRRQNLGFAVVIGAFYAVVWPVALPAAWCLSGFAEHGVFSQSKAGV